MIYGSFFKIILWEKYSQALGITCADVMNQYIAMKEHHPHPTMAQEMAEKVTECTKKTITAMEQSACFSIQQEFQSCLETGQRMHHKCAKQYKESLELCTAKNIGQLDA